MKSKELIKQLLDADPSGETEVCCGNLDIYFVENLEAYWDGKLQLLIHNEEIRGKAYSVVGAKVVRTGRKIQLHTMGIEDVILNDPETPVDLSELDKDDRWFAKVEELRKETKEIIAKVNAEMEAQYGKK